MKPIFTYAEAMEYIHQRSGYDRGFISNPFAGDEAARLGLIRTASVLESLGDPQNAYPIVHIAGSKGKGSTSTFVDSICQAHGLRSGRFLSPHLHRFNERFAIDGAPILDDRFAALVWRVLQAVTRVESDHPEVGHLTAWEISTALALRWFAEEACDMAVVEVGLGGTLDATNVVSPAACIVTRLDLEHQSILGSTIEQIASNKAGIFKPGVPAFTVSQPAGALPVLQQRADEVGASLKVAGTDWTVSGSSDDFAFESATCRLNNLKSALMGDHQVENAGLAISACRQLASQGTVPAQLSETAIRNGLKSAFLPGRFELAATQSGTTVVIDGAHTPESVRAVAHTIESRFPQASVTVVVGMLGDKDPKRVLRSLDGLANRWIACSVQSPRSLPAKEVAASLGRRGISAATAASVADGIAMADAQSGGNGLILAIGSLSTAAEARTALALDR